MCATKAGVYKVLVQNFETDKEMSAYEKNISEMYDYGSNYYG